MLKEIQSVITENDMAKNITHFAFPYYLSHKYGYRLNGEENNKLRRLLDRVRAGEPTSPSRELGLIEGYERRVNGLENLEQLKGKRFIVISNHFSRAPFAYFPFVMLMNSYVKEATGEEIAWVQGSGSSITTFLIKEISLAGNTIYVDNGKPSLKKAREEKAKHPDKINAIGIFAEGEISDKGQYLRIGAPKAGEAILKAVKQKKEIICIGDWFEYGTFYTNIGEPLSAAEIQKRANSSEEEQNPNQAAVDYVMENLARLLPPIYRGNYQYIKGPEQSF